VGAQRLDGSASTGYNVPRIAVHPCGGHLKRPDASGRFPFVCGSATRAAPRRALDEELPRSEMLDERIEAGVLGDDVEDREEEARLQDTGGMLCRGEVGVSTRGLSGALQT